MPVTRVVLSIDYDGCYAICAKDGIWNEYNGPAKHLYANQKLRASIKSAAAQFNDYLTRITRDAEAVSVYVGSARQSKGSDDRNASSQRNGSVFPALKELCRQRSTTACPWTFEPFLLADGDNPRGTALRMIECNIGPHLHVPIEKRSTSKALLLISQINDVHRTYPDDDLEFHFLDDTLALIEDVKLKITRENLPAGMTLKLSRFSYIDLALGTEGALKLVYQTSNPKVEEPVKRIYTSRKDVVRFRSDTTLTLFKPASSATKSSDTPTVTATWPSTPRSPTCCSIM